MRRQGVIWLVGMMGAGKSSVGQALARELATDFVDVDEAVVAAAGQGIPELFRSEGEAGFRRRELEAVCQAAQGRGVVALGGGALAEPRVAALVRGQGRAVYLKASAETLFARVGQGTGRPLLAGLPEAARLARIEALLGERQAEYETMGATVETDGLSEAEVVKRIVAALEDRP